MTLNTQTLAAIVAGQSRQATHPSPGRLSSVWAAHAGARAARSQAGARGADQALLGERLGVQGLKVQVCCDQSHVIGPRRAGSATTA